MKVEILFISSSTPKVIQASAVYCKGPLLCVELPPDKRKKVMILKYPLLNIFQVAHYHGHHAGTTKK